jgi:hypothetical protein
VGSHQLIIRQIVGVVVFGHSSLEYQGNRLIVLVTNEKL